MGWVIGIGYRVGYRERVKGIGRVQGLRLRGITSVRRCLSGFCRFQTDDTVRVAVLSLKAAGQGITLTAGKPDLVN